jgi:hypothetical protein
MGTTESKRLKINFYGESIRISKIAIPITIQEIWLEKIQQFKLPLSTLILDPFFYYKLKTPGINSYHDIATTVWEGILCNSQSHFEIWSERKKVFKDTLSNVSNDQTLFPLYKTVHKLWQFAPNEMYVIEQEKGWVRSCVLEHQTPKLILDDFDFHLVKWENQIWFEKLIFSNTECVSSNSDTVITNQYVKEF